MIRILENTTPDIFDTTRTDMSYYDNFLNPKDLAYMEDAKNKTGEVVYMTPEEYFEACVKYCFPDTTVRRLKEERRADIESLKYLNGELDKGNKFYLPMINTCTGGQEGLHRMMVAGDRYGWDTEFPVLIVKVYDEERERAWATRQKINDFEFRHMDNCVTDILWSNYRLEDVQDIPEWKKDFCDKLSDFVKEEYGLDFGFDCDVEDELYVWINEVDGIPYDPQMIDKHYDYKSHLRSGLSDEELDDLDLDVFNNIDDDDDDILGLFYKREKEKRE